MSPAVSVFIMMNNYFHDVATALLAASGIAMWIIINKYQGSGTPETRDYFFRIYKGITLIARIALFWILLGGIPRVLTFKDFEWSNAVRKNQAAGLILKHIIAFMLVAAGVYLWVKLSKRVRIIKER